jgi:hypothetical protein
MKIATNNLFLYVLLFVCVIGCGAPESKSSHTHLWTAGQQQHVWSYERVATTIINGGEKEEPLAFLKREIMAGEELEFDGGAVVTFDGSNLRVQNQLIKVTNVHVERDGSIRLNAFIRASD